MVLQDPAELARLVEIVAAEGCRSLLEIGSKFGGSLDAIARAMPRGSKVVSIDLPNGTKAWKDSKPALEGVVAGLKRDGYDAHLIWGSSTEYSVVMQASALGPYDVVFIDGDHRMDGVTRDWANYNPMARKLVAFHDIAWRRAPSWVGVRIDVPEFWNAKKVGYKHEEIVLCPTGKNNGIGVLWL